MATRCTMLCATALASLAFAGCGDEERSDDTEGTAPATQPGGPDAPEASVRFLAPRDGSTTGPRFTAKVKIENFEIDPGAVGKSPVAGKGHLHFSLDEGRFDIPEHSGPNGDIAKKLGVDGKYSPATEPRITYRDIPPGKHTLAISLANNNHTDTAVGADTEFTVK